jgi:hypothetical protein
MTHDSDILKNRTLDMKLCQRKDIKEQELPLRIISHNTCPDPDRPYLYTTAPPQELHERTATVVPDPYFGILNANLSEVKD